MIKEFPKLYSRTKNGQIRSYSVVCLLDEDDGSAAISTIKKVEPDGKETVDTYLFNEGKNIGKSNETTPWEQCLLEAESAWRKQQDKGYSEVIPENDYNTDANGNMKPMLAMKFNAKLIKYPCIAQPKLDGVRSLSWIDDNGEVHITSRLGKEYNIPRIKAYLSDHKDMLPLDGELYNHNELTFQEIVSAVKKQTDLTDRITLTVYDKPVANVRCEDRINKLLADDFRDVTEDAPIRLLESRQCTCFDELDKYHDECVERGYEGIIIRNLDGLYEFGFRSRDLIKLKKFEDKEFKVIDVVEATGRDAGTAVFVLEADNGEAFNAKPQGSHELRERYLQNKEDLIGRMCTVQFQGLSDAGIPRFPSAIAVRDYE